MQLLIKRHFQKRVVRTNFDIYIFITKCNAVSKLKTSYSHIS